MQYIPCLNLEGNKSENHTHQFSYFHLANLIFLFNGIIKFKIPNSKTAKI